ncbi:MAG: hypothetical protein COA43_15215 [Robiginitomaculum sp.]|nr:MAG: hypothetical protein COA43_15215 [Robiginitomaculum sp.]
MAGSNQHYIPRFVLRAFKDQYRPSHVWKYSKGFANPKHSAIKKTASQDYFYSQISERQTLDDRVTDLENRIAPIHANILKLQDGPITEPIEDFLKLMVHLEVRTKHARQFMPEVLIAMIRSLETIVSDKENLREWLGVNGQSLHPKLRAEMLARIQGGNSIETLNLREDTIERVLTFLVREKFDTFIADALTSIKDGVNEAIQMIPDSAIGDQTKPT